MTVPGFSPQYNIESPYRLTPVIGNFMAYYIHRSIDPQPEDIHVTLDNQRYVERPDLLAADLYGDPNLWWVFGVRNGMEDPVYDMKFGINLFLPQLEYIRAIL